MHTNIILPLLLKAGITLVLALLTLFGAEAQEAAAGTRKVHIKIAREVDGKMTMTDTVLHLAGDAALSDALRGLKADTALLRTLRSRTLRAPGTGKTDIRDLELIIRGAEGMMAGAEELSKLQEGRVKAYRLDAALPEAERMALLERLKTMQPDSALLNHVKTLKFDSLRLQDIRKIEIIRGSDSLFRARPGTAIRIRTAPDSVLSGSRNQVELFNINPAEIDRIVVLKEGSAAGMQELKPGAVRFKVITGKDGEQPKVYRLDEAGKELEAEMPGLLSSPGSAATIILFRTSIKEITAADKQALKATGAPVETSPKEELKLEAISFYPNPNNGRFNFSFTLGQKGPALVRVLDSTGREVFTEKVEKQEGEYNREIDLTPFGRGVYYVQVAQGKRYQTRKIVVQ